MLMHIYLLREQEQLLEQGMMLMQGEQMKEVKVSNLKIEHHLLNV